MFRALVGGGVYVIFVVGIVIKWWSKRQSDSGSVKPKDTLIPKTYEQIDDLIGALSDSRWQVRLNAIQQLSEHPTTDAIPLLINRLADDDPDVRLSASQVLIKIGQDALPAVLSVLENGSLNTRIAAIETLAKVESTETFAALSQTLLHDESNWVRLPAVLALASYPARLTTPVLIQALSDENQEVYHQVAMLLRDVGTDEALQAIKQHPYKPLNGTQRDTLITQ